MTTAIGKPEEVFARDREWAALDRQCVATGPPWLSIVSGRRRQGKTLLVESLVARRGGLYFCAAQQSAHQNLADLATAVTQWAGGTLPIAFSSWDQALDVVLDRAASLGVPVAVDEVGYLISRFDAFPSLLQRQLDRRRHAGAPVLLCGSSVSVLAQLTGAGQPLRGRAGLELVVQPFDAPTTAAFWGISDPLLALAVWGLVGGTPAYRQWCTQGPPRRRQDLVTWVGDHLLDVTSPLHREGRTVVLESDELGDRAAHQGVLTAIARGAGTRSSIAAAVGRPATALAAPLDALTAAGLVSVSRDPLHDRRTRYDVADPIVRTWHTLVAPVERRLLHVDAHQVVEGVLPEITRLVAAGFEQLVRDWVEGRAGDEVTGGPITAVGSSAVHTGRPADSPGNQIDVVAVDRQPSGRRLVRLLGEVKHQTRPVGREELVRLEQLRERLGTPTTKLLIASSSGFNADLERVGRRRADVELVGPEHLFSPTHTGRDALPDLPTFTASGHCGPLPGVALDDNAALRDLVDDEPDLRG